MNAFDWNNVLLSDDVQVSFDLFWNCFNDFFQEIFPLKKRKVNKNKFKVEKWMTKGILISRKTKLKLRKKSLEYPTFTYISEYKTYRNLYNKIVRKAKEKYYNDTFFKFKNNPKKTWGLLNEIRKKKQNAPIDKLTIDGKSINDINEIAECFNDHFSSIANKIVTKIPPSSSDFLTYLGSNPSSEEFSPPIVGGEKIIEVVQNFESKNSTDINGLSVTFLKKIIYSIARPLTHIFNLSFQQGRIPSQLKTCRVVPIFKSGKKDCMDHFRPIGLINVFAKVMEKILCLNLTNFLETNNLIYIHQYGFRKSHSTIHPMIHFLNMVAEASNKKEFTIAIFCDLQKCFDVFDREILLRKMDFYGIRGIALEWFKDYFTDRSQFVDLNGNFSSVKSSTLGVIQGSILGPILSNLYLNDLHKVVIKLLLFSFADDSKFVYSDKSLENLILTANLEFRKVAQWMRANRLMLHPDKTKYMIFCPRQKPIDTSLCKVFLNNNDIGATFEDPRLIKEITFLNIADEPIIRFLGLYLDPHLTFRFHVTQILSKISKGLYIMRTVKNILPESALKTLYFSLINSHLIYALPAYGCADRSILNPLIKIQKKAIRIVSKSKWNSHSEPIFQRLGIMRFEDMIKYSQLEFMHLFEHQRLPESFKNIWRTRNEILSVDNYSLRRAIDLHIETPRTNFSQKLPLHTFPSLWNTLEPEMKQLWPPKLFKKTLKSQLLSKLNSIINCENPFCPDCYNQN
jgi:hypothetical protein